MESSPQMRVIAPETTQNISSSCVCVCVRMGRLARPDVASHIASAPRVSSFDALNAKVTP
jgi:hypothetical protein